MADKYETRSCGRCSGTGRFHWATSMGTAGGVCFKCGGKGTVEWNLSAEKRRETAQQNFNAKAGKNIEAFKAANPDLADYDAFLQGNFMWSLHESIMRYGSLTEKQLNAMKSWVTKSRERAAAHAARQAAWDAEKARIVASSKYQGAVGDKIEVAVKLTFKKVIETKFGYSTLYGFEDASGNQYRWFSTSYTFEMQEGQQAVIKGTVKKHETYKDVAQTMLTRVKMVGEPSQAPAVAAQAS